MATFGTPTKKNRTGRKERVGTEKIKRDKGYLYFIDKKGYVSRTKLNASGSGVSNSTQLFQTASPYPTRRRTTVASRIIGYLLFIAIIVFIVWVASFFRTSTTSSSPTLNSSWVTHFFQNVSNTRNQTISNCNNLDAYAMQRYYTLKDGSNNPSEWDENITYIRYSLNQNETVLAPIQIQTPEPYSYVLPYPKTYLVDNLDNSTEFFRSSYSYYGYFIYPTTGIFNSSGSLTTAPTQHVLIELSGKCV